MQAIQRTKIIVISLISGCILSMGSVQSDNGAYRSPYEVKFSVPMEELLAPNSSPPRDNKRLESEVPFEDWYSPRVRKEFGSWGPEPRHYPPLNDIERIPVSWKRQRVLAVAYSMIGLPYQHHHIPDWDPPASWPWKEVAYGRNSKGVDCSDFTSWVYNYGLGIKPKTSVTKQAELTQVNGPGENRTTDVRVIQNDNGYDDLVKKLKTGDLLYIRNNKGIIGHVIMWVGSHGQSPDGAPLIIDCTGEGHRDSNGNSIPIGVNLRPFLPNEWYFKSFAHAHRILHDE